MATIKDQKLIANFIACKCGAPTDKFGNCEQVKKEDREYWDYLDKREAQDRADYEERFFAY